ncbi:lanthionine synthetase LanC family protein [Lactobacillus amylovorus]|jgi:lantibiotic modifying enzyme|uniref:lanthionine synthetase LanC family protein n=1 Tax=Lactobacillus amylovorus TaxID=1604 RepID=UPI001CCDB521|nr:lanthionine synthetase LanC family protein [Lactobacillus amylovorus]
MIKIEQEISRILDHSLDSCIQNLKEKSTDIGVANGLAGMSIFLSDIYRTTNSVDKKILIKNTNLKITQAMINSINKNNVSLSLFSGLSGVGTACLEMAKYDSNYLKLLTQISLIITNKVEKVFAVEKYQQQNMIFAVYDLFNGSVGILDFLFHANELIHSARVNRGIEQLINFLIRISYVDFNDISQSPIYLLKKNLPENGESRILLPNGGLFMGMAHGLAGILSILSEVYSRFSSPELKEHIQRLLNVFLKFRNNKTLYPECITAVKNTSISSLNGGWCFGSLGILRAMLKAARSIDNVLLINKLQKEFEFVLKNWKTDIRPNSLILCHGLINAIYSSYILFLETKEETFNYYMNDMLEFLLSHVNWNKRYLFSDVSMNLYDNKCRYEMGILEGELGVSLVLNAISHNVRWQTDWLFLY